MAIRKQPRVTTKKRVVGRKPKHELTIFERLVRIGESIPEEELAGLPRDLAKNFDHYAHGSPRED